jgi:hypothetical protein
MLGPSATDDLSEVRGVAVHEGTRALVFSQGEVAADLRNGFFDFDRSEPGDGAKSRGGIFSFMTGARPANDGPRTQDPASGKPPRPRLTSVLLVRQGPLPLIVTLREVATASVTTTVSLQFMVEITDPVKFHRSLMQVRSELGLNALATAITPVIESALRQELRQLAAEAIVPDPGLERRLAGIMVSALGEDWDFVRLVRVAKVYAYRGELARLEDIDEVTYLSERALHQAGARNEFANRLRLVRNRQRIEEASDTQHLHAELQRINRDGLLSQDDLARFQLLLDHSRRIREATSEDEYQAALNGLRKSELVREDSLSLMARDLTERNQDHARQRMHSLALFDLSRQIETDQARLQWEYDIGDKRLTLALERRMREYLARYEIAAVGQQHQRLQDDYADERQDKGDRHADQRRRIAHELDHRERLAQLDITRQAQALTESRRRDEHQRGLAAAAQHAKDERENRLAAAQRWAGMTAEQIMAANPELSPAAAASLATKYTAEAMATAEKSKAEAAAAGGDHRAQAAETAKNELRDFMTQQLATMQDLMRHTLEANARIAGAFAAGGQATQGSLAKAGPGTRVAYCSRCGRPLGGGVCPVCPADRPE